MKLLKELRARGIPGREAAFIEEDQKADLKLV